MSIVHWRIFIISDAEISERSRWFIRSVTKCCMLRILKLLNRLRREAEFHWRLEPYAGKLARTVFRGEDGSNVIFLLDGYKCTESLRSRKAAQYPSHYGTSRTSRYRDDISNKKVCADCVGLIKGYCWTGGGKGVIESIGTDSTYASSYGANDCPDKSANSMFTYAKSKGCS